ncbi:LLM class flavin-dependent oxidoreductase [Nibricoccus aquaticus]|uniref:Luciferase-like monooxygenase n=1 Tax=Nibricoccus aquaticus TaxID=2576891 RepID=A0A290QEJ5_9BACT|nr:LLM class flavin-dependent oxidoreductase [Nibricoccus aquaticus]
MVPLSVLDLSPITQGSDATQALRNSLDLARHSERLGYKRFWLAEHHSMPGIASAATAVAIGYVAGGTKTIRVGSGGIMLPNHSPLVIAEQFGTLDALYPGRIDLGLGRAPGSDQRTARALRRERANTSADTFPQDVLELQGYFQPAMSGQSVRAIPGEGRDVPIWLLGSSLFSAQLAAALGLPYAFAGHFAPDSMLEALAIYRREFKPSEQLAESYAMVGVGVVAAETDVEAERLATSLQQQFVSLHRGVPGQLQPPVDDLESVATPQEVASVRHTLREAIVGSRLTVKRRLEKLLQRTGVDEIIATSHIFDHAARLRSYEILAAVRDELAEKTTGVSVAAR